jgi:hypothetical protein
LEQKKLAIWKQQYRQKRSALFSHRNRKGQPDKTIGFWATAVRFQPNTRENTVASSMLTLSPGCNEMPPNTPSGMVSEKAK